MGQAAPARLDRGFVHWPSRGEIMVRNRKGIERGPLVPIAFPDQKFADSWSMLHAALMAVRCSVSTASPQAAGKSLRTFVDAALALDERGKRFGARLVLRCITESLVDFLLSKISSHPAKCRTLRLTAFDPSRRTWASLSWFQLLARLNREVRNCFTVSTVALCAASLYPT